MVPAHQVGLPIRLQFPRGRGVVGEAGGREGNNRVGGKGCDGPPACCVCPDRLIPVEVAGWAEAER